MHASTTKGKGKKQITIIKEVEEQQQQFVESGKEDINEEDIHIEDDESDNSLHD